MLDLFWGIWIDLLFTSHLENHYLHQRQEKKHTARSEDSQPLSQSSMFLPFVFLSSISAKVSCRFAPKQPSKGLNILTNLNASKLSKVFWLYAILPKSSLAISILDRLYRSNSAKTFFSASSPHSCWSFGWYQLCAPPPYLHPISQHPQ